MRNKMRNILIGGRGYLHRGLYWLHHILYCVEVEYNCRNKNRRQEEVQDSPRSMAIDHTVGTGKRWDTRFLVH